MALKKSLFIIILNLIIHHFNGYRSIKSNFNVFRGFSLNMNKKSLISSSFLDRIVNQDDFPVLNTKNNLGKHIVYLDSAASSQKPVKVLDAMNYYYRNIHSNVHRGVHFLSIKATEEYEEARNSVQSFINAKYREEIVFTRGATESINLVALGLHKLNQNDEIILSTLEHHSNIIPWQILSKKTGVKLKFVQLDKDLNLDIDHFKALLSEKTKLVSLSHVSNVIGVLNPIKEFISLAHDRGIKVLVDACQSVPHLPIDVQDLDADFLVFSSHKMCGPTGIGVLYGKKGHLESMDPIFGGGEMIDEVSTSSFSTAPLPYKFEAGTPPIAEALGLAAACKYLNEIGMQNIYNHSQVIGRYLYDQLSNLPDVEIYGSPEKRLGLVSFNVRNVHPTDLAFFLDQEGIAVRSGHHCAQPLHNYLKKSGSLRASTYLYNNLEEIDFFIEILQRKTKMLL